MNADKPDRFIGKIILIGLRHYDQDEKLTSQEQLVGTISSIEDEEVIDVDLDGGGTFGLPPFLWAIADAPSGEYRCVSAGQTIVNPDFLTSWSLYDDPEAPGSGPSWRPNNTVVHNTWGGVHDWEFTYKPDFERMWRMIIDRGESFVHKHLIIGVRYYKRVGDEEEFIRQEQMHGVIVRVSRYEGIVVQLGSGEEKKLPPDLALLQPASPGEYRLASTGEVLVNPDYLTTWATTSSSD